MNDLKTEAWELNQRLRIEAREERLVLRQLYSRVIENTATMRSFLFLFLFPRCTIFHYTLIIFAFFLLIIRNSAVYTHTHMHACIHTQFQYLKNNTGRVWFQDPINLRNIWKCITDEFISSLMPVKAEEIHNEHRNR